MAAERRTYKPWIGAVSPRRRARVLIVSCIAMCGAVALTAAPAFAGWGSPVKIGEGELSFPVGAAVDSTTGDLYVGNLEGFRLDAFDPAHQLIAPPSPFGEEPPFYSGTAVNPINRRLYAVQARLHQLDTYDPTTGALVSSPFEVPGAGDIRGEVKWAAVQIASDSAGNVYVPEAEDNRIGVFEENGEPPSGVAATITGTGASALSKPRGVAVDTAGNVWVADTGHNRIEEFEPSGSFVREIPSEGVQAVALDAADDVFASVFASAGAEVVEYDPSGTEVEAFGLGVLGKDRFGEFQEPTPNGIAIDDVRHIVYVADGANNAVWAFTKLPAASTQPASGIGTTSATLHGTVNPNGELVSGCEFEYASNREYETEHLYTHKVSCEQSPEQIGSGAAPVSVSAEVGGLEADETYHFRLRASSEAGSALGGDETFIAIEPVFGFQLSGQNALEVLVSTEADNKEPAAASSEKLDTQAGSHPFDVTTRFLINTESNRNLPVDLQPKDYYVNVPAGFAGSVANIPRCKMSELSSLKNRQRPPGCPTASQVGVIRIFRGAGSGTNESEPLPVYNMVPPPGAPAEFAFPIISIGEPIVFQVRSDGDYGITAKVPNISEALQVIGSQLTLWGVPANAAHDAERFLPERGAAYNTGFIPGDAEGKPLPAGTAEVPFLTNPTKCGAQEETTVRGDSWLHPGKLAEDGLPVPGGENWVTANTPMFPDGITGCEKLTFQPELEIKPTSTVADSPTGMTVDLRVPQSEGPNNLATPSLKDATVTLPQGLSISPSQANGLEGCTPEEIGLGSMREPSCPNASQVGKLELVTPLLPEPLDGRIYLSSERSDNTFHVYLVIEGQGVLVKLKGDVVANEATGQLTSTFDENPQLPFSDLKLTFYPGRRAALSTPNACGSYRTTSLFEPWSHEPAPGEAHGTPNAEPGVEPFQVASACASGFAPGLKAGSLNPVAGRYAPFGLTITRQDKEQELSGVQVSLPQGLVGKLAGVAECGDAQIAHAEHNTGTAEKASPSCPASSFLGTVQAGAGPGEEPFFSPGRTYLTGPYKGAPYGMVTIVPVLAGPFDLGTVVVRSAIYIDPHTAQVTVKSDPLPKMLDGIPLQVRRIEVSVDRPDFTLNPTNCEPAQVSGLLSSFEGAQHEASARFQVGDCGSLAFKPGFKVFTKARHTRRFGAFLRVKVTSGPGQANIKSVFVKLPKALPSRVATLKGACAEKQFAENPAGCPAAATVGTAIARTPILSTPLTGPAMFVSHGGAAFPDLDIVLQGAGITVILEGNTDIKHNITTSNFKSAPDVPVNSFELTLPTGPRSALAANGNLCFKTVRHGKHRVRRRVKLVMPTTITGHNGAVMRQSTVIDVEGCGVRGQGHKHR